MPVDLTLPEKLVETVARSNSEYDFWYYVADLVFLAVVLFFMAWLSKCAFELRKTEQISGSTFFKVIGICAVIGSGSVIVGLNMDSHNAELMLNILAAIAGYVFGRTETKDSRPSPATPMADEPITPET